MIDVALRPADVRAADIAVVIDVLRATSTATQALAAGYERVLCVESIERAEALRGPGRVLAGERSCVKPDGFDQGNSPIEATQPAGSELVLATTNGTPAVAAAAGHARRVLLACMLNLAATIRATLLYGAGAELELQLVCSGTNGAVAVEDVYVAGRVSLGLPGPRTDATLVAEAVTRGFRSPLEALSASADARALEAAGMSDDIAFCAQESVLEIVPTLLRESGGVAIVARSENATRRAPPDASARTGDRSVI